MAHLLEHDPEYTISKCLNSMSGYEFLLKRGLKPAEGWAQKAYFPGHTCYQFLRKEGSNFVDNLAGILDRLAKAGVMTKADADLYISRICNALVDEFAELCPPPEGSKYRYVGRYFEHLFLEIVPADTEEKEEGLS